MPIRVILVPLDGSEASRPAMQLAFAVGRDRSAHVRAFHVAADPKAAVPLLGEGMSGAMIEEMISVAERESRERARVARLMFDEYCAHYDIPAADPGAGAQPGELNAWWEETVGREDDAVARRARTADLVVLGRPVAGEDVPSALTLNAALFETGRPVLMAPPETPAATGTRIGIAWNGSPQAARAVAAALPFLRAADSVFVLTAETESTAEREVGQLVDYLAWHDITAEPVTFSPAGHGVGEAMLMEVGKLECDLLVMGAFTHSRVRQMILGGVTRHVMDNSRVPVLMAH